jgi:hypothetical protein
MSDVPTFFVVVLLFLLDVLDKFHIFAVGLA